MQTEDLDKHRRRLLSPAPLIGGLLQQRALRSLARDRSAEAIRLLEESAIGAAHETSRDAAFDLLVSLAAQANIPAREALCRLVVFHGHREALDVVAAQEYLPSEDSQRAVFFFLLGRWDKYDALDFDGRLLREAYERADLSLRRRLAAQARREGRVDWVDVAAGGAQGKRLGQMSDAEWRAALTVLTGNKRWPDLRRLAQAAPPLWSAALLRCCPAVGPENADNQSLNELRRLAQAWPPEDFAGVFYHAASLSGHSHEVRCLAIDATGRFLASGSADRTARLWSLQNRTLLATCTGHSDWVNCLAFLQNRSVLVSAGRDGRLRSWRVPQGKRLRKHRRQRRPILCMGTFAEEGLVMAGSADGHLCYWDPATGAMPVSVQAHDLAVSCLAVAAQYALCITGGGDSRVCLWSLPQGKLVRTLAGHRVGAREPEGVVCLAVSPDGKTLASGGTDGAICLWNLPGGSLREKCDGHKGQVTTLAFSGDSRLLVSGGSDRRIHLWRADDGALENTLEDQMGEIGALAVAPDGDLLATSAGGGWGVDHSVRLWRLAEGTAVAVLAGHDRSVAALAFGPSGDLLCTGARDGTIGLWTSELHRLARRPVTETGLQDLAWLEASLARPDLSSAERAAMNFIAALIRRRRRSDILVDEAGPRVVEIGAFDIELEG